MNLDSSPAEAEAWIENSSIYAAGDVTIDAISDQEIDAIVFAGAVALAGGLQAGVGVSGAGVYTENRVETHISAYIDGDGASGITASSISLNADDTSTITADAGAASLAAAFGLTAGVAVSVGIALATNQIDNEISAYITNADQSVKTTTGGISIDASETATIDALSLAASIALGAGSTAGIAVSGAGAWARNVILSDINAYISNSEIDSHTYVDIDATNEAAIDATIVAASVAVAGGSTAGVGVSIGISIAENRIGATDDPAEVRAWIKNSAVNAQTGALSLNADGRQSVEALVFAGSVALAFAGTAAIGASGAGVGATNLIAADIHAFIEDDDNNNTTTVTGIHATSIEVKADDQSTIHAGAAAASVAFALGGPVGVGFSIGVSLARNEIRNDVAAWIADAANVEARTGDIVIDAGVEEDPTGLPADYGTSQTVALKKGDTVTVGSDVYRFLGEGAKVRPTWESSATAVYLKTGDLVKVMDGDNDGGEVGAIYRYTGANIDPPADSDDDDLAVDLSEENYSDTGSWALVDEFALYDTNSGEVDVETGDFVEVVPGYSILFSSEDTDVDLVQNKTYVSTDDGSVYKYIGTARSSVDLEDEDYFDTAKWLLATPTKDEFGVGGTFYRYLGNDATDLDLTVQDYTDTSAWEQVTRDLRDSRANLQHKLLVLGEDVVD